LSTYSSKILLFGEHIVNKGAEALAIPYANFSAKLSFDKLHSAYIEASPEILQKIWNYIAERESLAAVYDMDRFKTDLIKGLGFHMNIPIGYGLGSSGALIAAVFDRFTRNKDLSEGELKRILGETESVFHGKSSGLDPLVSYLNQSIWVAKETKTVKEDLLWRDSFEIFLVNTNQARQTGPLVEAFMLRTETDEEFARMLKDEMIPVNDAIVHNFIRNEHETSLGLIERLSGLQLAHLKELILPKHIDLFLLGLATKDYFLKICGAGGGGFMLGFTHNKEVKLPFEVIWI
jgi:mevalonate kinase